MIQEHAVHRQSQVLYCHADLVVGLFGINRLNDAVPLLVADHEVVLHHLLRLEVSVLPDETSHDGKDQCKRAKSHGKALRSAHPFPANAEHQREDNGRQPCGIEQIRCYRRVAMIMAAAPGRPH